MAIQPAITISDPFPLLVMIGFGQVGKALGYGVSAVLAIRANIDYDKKTVLGENGWWSAPRRPTLHLTLGIAI